MSGLGALLGRSSGDSMAAAETSRGQGNESIVETNQTTGETEVKTANTDFNDFGDSFDKDGDQDSGDQEPKLIVTSAPVQNFKIGRFQFTRAVLNLFTDEDVTEFRELVKTLAPADRVGIRIIDREAAENMVRPIEPSATKQFDSSVGRMNDRIGGDPAVGTQALDAQVVTRVAGAMTDNNKPVDGAPMTHVVNEENKGDVQSQAEIDQLKKVDDLNGEKI